MAAAIPAIAVTACLAGVHPKQQLEDLQKVSGRSTLMQADMQVPAWIAFRGQKYSYSVLYHATPVSLSCQVACVTCCCGWHPLKLSCCTAENVSRPVKAEKSALEMEIKTLRQTLRRLEVIFLLCCAVLCCAKLSLHTALQPFHSSCLQAW